MNVAEAVCAKCRVWPPIVLWLPTEWKDIKKN